MKNISCYVASPITGSPTGTLGDGPPRNVLNDLGFDASTPWCAVQIRYTVNSD